MDETFPYRTYLEQAQHTVARLNRAAGDLGLTLKGRPLFVLDSHSILGQLGEPPLTIVYDITVNVEDFAEYAELATKLEQLNERYRVTLADRKSTEIPGQLAFDLDRL